MTNERVLINNVISGDTKAFAALVKMHHRKVIAVSLSFVKVPQDAEDISQEVFIEVYRSIKDYRGEASLSTWLYRLAVNKSLDFIRQKKRVKRGDGKIISLGKDDLESVNAKDPGIIGEDIELQERKKILMAAIDLLPERQKVAIVLSKIDELSQQEVAETMQVSISSVESLLVRAKKKLRELLIHKKEEIF